MKYFKFFPVVLYFMFLSAPIAQQVDWCNLQWPATGSIFPHNSFDTYGRAYEPGVTPPAGAPAGLEVWVGYSPNNTNPNTWPESNWISASWNVQVGNDDEFIGTFPANTFQVGTYYYAYRYRLDGGPFTYGGYSSGGGGFWDGSTYVSGVLTVNPVYIIEFENPTQNATHFSWDIRIKAVSTPFVLLASNIRYNFNNSALSTTTTPTFTITAAGYQFDAASFQGTTTVYVNLGFSPTGSGVSINTTGLVLGTVSHPRAPGMTNGLPTDIRVRAWNVPGYTNYAPTASAVNCTRIFTQDSPSTPVQAGTPGNLPNILLPIIIKNWSVEKVGKRSARLSWTSSSEINASHYEIERSEDAENFEKLGEIKAAGNSQSLLKYEFFDNKIEELRTQRIYYYRLKMVDLDGSYEYSDIRGLNFGNDLAGVFMYPNPTNQWLNVDVNGVNFEDSSAELNVFDFEGKLLITKEVIGSGIEAVDLGQFSAGLYHVVLKKGREVYNEKVVVID